MCCKYNSICIDTIGSEPIDMLTTGPPNTYLSYWFNYSSYVPRGNLAIIIFSEFYD